MTAKSSMRLLVVSGSPPEACFSVPLGDVPQDKRPAARPRIAAARAVGEELDVEYGGIVAVHCGAGIGGFRDLRI